MAIWQEVKRRVGEVAGPVLGFCVLAYFVYHAVEGDRGLSALVRLNEQAQLARLTLEELSSERAALDRRVALLRPNNLDPDLLEERARAILNWVRPDELVIYDRPADHAPARPKR